MFTASRGGGSRASGRPVGARTYRGPSKERGIALVLVLWLTIMMTVIASGFAFSMRNEVLAARNELSYAQARAAADGAIERTAFELARPRLPQSWNADGVERSWREGDIDIVVMAVDESAKIDINTAPEALLKGLFEHVGGADPDMVSKIVDSILDWRDPDDVKRPNGAEEQDYRQAGLKQKPANGWFETVSELARVMNVTPTMYARVADSLTTQSRQPGINAATASRDVLLALPDATAATVDAYIQQRSDALKSKLPIPPFPPAAAYVAGAVPTWRIRALARASDGVTFARDAIVRPSGDGRRPLLTLAWQEGLVEAAPTVVDTTSGNDQRDTKSANGRP